MRAACVMYLRGASRHAGMLRSCPDAAFPCSTACSGSSPQNFRLLSDGEIPRICTCTPRYAAYGRGSIRRFGAAPPLPHAPHPRFRSDGFSVHSRSRLLDKAQHSLARYRADRALLLNAAHEYRKRRDADDAELHGKLRLIIDI